MAIPLNRLSSRPIVGPFKPPYDRPRTSLTDFQLGGIALNNATQGLEYQVWNISLQGNDIVITPETTGSPVILLENMDGVTELSLAFDQNMNPFVTFVQDGRAKYYWYSPVEQEYITTLMDEDVQTPRCRLDDTRPSQLANGRIILAYVRSGTLYYRSQEDRYETEYSLTPVDSLLERIGMGVNWRFQFEMVSPTFIEPPVITPVTEVTIPYWTNFGGNFIDLSLCTEKTWDEVYGVPFASDDEYLANTTVSAGSGLTPWKIRLQTSDTGNRYRFRFSNGVTTNSYAALVYGDGTIYRQIKWSTGDPDTDDLPIPVNTAIWLVTASETDLAYVRKVDISPAPDVGTEPEPPGANPNPNNAALTAQYESFWGEPMPGINQSNGLDPYFIAPNTVKSFPFFHVFEETDQLQWTSSNAVIYDATVSTKPNKFIGSSVVSTNRTGNGSVGIIKNTLPTGWYYFNIKQYSPNTFTTQNRLNHFVRNT